MNKYWLEILTDFAHSGTDVVGILHHFCIIFNLTELNSNLISFNTPLDSIGEMSERESMI